MNRAEYLDELKRCVLKLTLLDAVLILAECDRAFQRGSAFGLTEEAVSASLGSPRSLIELCSGAGSSRRQAGYSRLEPCHN